MPEIATPFNPFPQLPLCVCVPPPPQEICITLPFGIEICSTRSTIARFEGLDGMLMGFVGNLQPLLAPLIPLLLVISLVKALVDCVFAIKDAISQLSPSPVIECIEKLAELLPQFFQFIPPFNYIELINNLLLFFITLLEAVIDAIEQALSIDIDAEINLLPEDDRLRCCLDGNITAFLDQIAAALRMSGPILLVLAQLLSILELPGIKPFIKPLREKVEQLNDLTAANIDPGLVELLRDIQGILRDISDVVTAIGASPLAQAIQKANECDCD